MDYFGLHHAESHNEIIKAIRNLSPKESIVVEIGAYVGGSTVNFLGDKRRIFCVDPWPWETIHYDRNDSITKEFSNRGGGAKVFEKFCENTKEFLFNEINPIRAYSCEAAKVFPFKIDLIYFDGEHTYEGFKSDFLAWKHLFKKGTIISGDDYGHPGVTQAINELIGKENLKSFHSEGIIWHLKAEDIWERIYENSVS